MNFLSILKMFFGLTVFLIGMNSMTKSLEKFAGGKLSSALGKFTDNTFKGVISGAALTAVLQSSSAVTVMVIGLTGAGVLTLSESFGVIIGSNIGTTATAWILCVPDLNSGSALFKIICELIKPTAVLIGILFVLFSKRNLIKVVGKILLSFTALLYGMEIMKSSAEPLASPEGFGKLLSALDNPLICVFAGAVFTGIIQSSSASTGVLQALSRSGAVPFKTAVPIIIGQNIGTCVTALLSSIGAGRNAKRISLTHLIFNISGAVIFLLIYCIFNSIAEISFLERSISPVEIAAVHSLFNIVTSAAVLPFRKAVLNLTKFIVPEIDKRAVL